jgi:hypothetical protein
LADDIIGRQLASPASFAPLHNHPSSAGAFSTLSAADAFSMAADSTPDEPGAAARDEQKASHGKPAAHESASEDDDDDDDDDEADEADEEPKLKYTRLTSSLAPVYRNGDATSAFLVAGDKMVGRTLPAPGLRPSQSTC